MFLVYRQHLPERRRFEASSYSEGGLGSDQRIELRISTETPLDILPSPLPPPWHRPTPSQLYSKGQKQVGTRVGLWPNFGWLAKFPDLVAKESIVRDLRIYFVPARRLSLADDWRCTSPSASIQTKWNVTAACPKFIWHSMTGPPYGSQRSNMIPFTCNDEQSWLR